MLFQSSKTGAGGLQQSIQITSLDIHIHGTPATRAAKQRGLLGKGDGIRKPADGIIDDTHQFLCARTVLCTGTHENTTVIGNKEIVFDDRFLLATDIRCQSFCHDITHFCFQVLNIDTGWRVHKGKHQVAVAVRQVVGMWFQQQRQQQRHTDQYNNQP